MSNIKYAVRNPNFLNTSDYSRAVEITLEQRNQNLSKLSITSDNSIGDIQPDMNARDLRGTTGYPILKLSKMMQPTTKDRHTPGSESESTQGVDKQFARVVVFVVNGN